MLFVATILILTTFNFGAFKNPSAADIVHAVTSGDLLILFMQ